MGQSLTLLLGEEKIKKEVRVDGCLAIKAPFTGFLVTSQMEVILSCQFFEKLFKEPHITSLGIDVKKGYDQRIYYELKDKMEADYLMESRYLGKKAMEESRTILYTLGGGISVILGLIGIFNFVNVISVGIITRTQEIAALECIGMSKKQMRKSLGLEGLFYGGITITASLTIGNLVAAGLFYLFQRIEPTAKFTYPFLPVLAVDIVILLVCAVVPLRVYTPMSKKTLVERLNKNLDG